MPSHFASPLVIILVSVYLEVPQDPTLVFLYYLQRCFTSWSWDFQPRLGTDISVIYASYLVMGTQVCSACWHLTPCCYVLDCLWGVSLFHLESCLVWSILAFTDLGSTKSFHLSWPVSMCCLWVQLYPANANIVWYQSCLRTASDEFF